MNKLIYISIICLVILLSSFLYLKFRKDAAPIIEPTPLPTATQAVSKQPTQKPTYQPSTTPPTNCDTVVYDEYDMAIPVITSVTPDPIQIGKEIKIKGCNLSGFEGNTGIWLEDSKGVKGYIPGPNSMGQLVTSIKVTLGTKICHKDLGESGLPCSSWWEIVPGTYKLYADLYSKSNIVEVNIVK